jgi:hypothetical protein
MLLPTDEAVEFLETVQRTWTSNKGRAEVIAQLETYIAQLT